MVYGRWARWVLVCTLGVGCGGGPSDARDAVSGGGGAHDLGAVTLLPAAPVTGDALSADVVGDVPDGAGVAWSRDGAVQPDLSGWSVPAGRVWRGERWSVDVLADGQVWASASTDIGNAAPAVSSVEITPELAQSGDLLAVSAQGDDPEGAALSWVFAWSVDGVDAGQGETFDTAGLVRGQQILALVSPSDGELAGDAVASDPLVLMNAPPVLLGAQLSPVAPSAHEDDLVCAPVGDPSDVDGDDVSLEITWAVQGTRYDGAGTTTSPGDTVPASVTTNGQQWVCEITPDDGWDAGEPARASVTIGPCAAGSHPDCPAASCADVLLADASAADGDYWLDPEGGSDADAVLTRCDLMGGGWALLAVVSDDDQATWTWNQRSLWGGELSSVGDVSSLDADLRSELLARLPMWDLRFVHAPSGQWAQYDGVGDGVRSLGALIDDTGEAVCWETDAGAEMTDGSISVSGDLCETRLYLNIRDHDSRTHCDCSVCNQHSHGPSWSAANNGGCPFDDPGLSGGLGPVQGDAESESSALGFAGPLGLNTGTSGSGENRVEIWAR